MGVFSRDYNIRINTILGVKGIEKFEKLTKAEEKFEKQINKARKTIEKRQKRMQGEEIALNKRSKFYNKWTKELKVNQAGLGKVMSEAGLHINKNGEIVDKAGKVQKRYGSKLRESSFAARRFQMEQLGVMFGGMALNRVMSNLNATSREWVGMNELMSTAMGIVTLPTTLALMNLGIIPLFEALTNLPESAQKAIGTTTIALEGLGGVMMVGGQLALGASSLLTVLEKMGGDAGAAAGATKMLKKLGGVTLVGISIGFVIAALDTEGPNSIGYAIAAGIAAAFATSVFGFSAASGIAVGGIVVTATLLWKFVNKLSEESEDYRTIGGAVPQGVTDINIPGISQNIQEKWTRSFMPNLPEGIEGFQLQGLGNQNSGSNVTVSPVYNFNGFTNSDLERAIKQSENNTSNEIKRVVRVS